MQDRNTWHKDGELMGFGVAPGVVIAGGAIVCANAEGLAVAGSAATGLAYLGCADAPASDGTVLVRRGKVFCWDNDPSDPVLQSSVGRLCYVAGPHHVAKTHGGNSRSPAGVVLEISGDRVWVQ